MSPDPTSLGERHDPDPARLVDLLRQAVDHAVAHVEAGGLPFVGVLLLADATTSPMGVNRVRETGDPDAHAEVEAMRAVLAARGPDALRGATLLATGEPCSRCYRFAAAHGVARSVHAVDVDRAAALGFDYRGDDPGPGGAELARAARHLPVEGAERPFTTYLARHPGRTPLRFDHGRAQDA